MMQENNKNKTVSQIIFEAVKMKGYSLEKISQLTGISDRFLNAFIEEKLNRLPAAPYVHGYILKLANVLDLDGEKLWSEYLKNNNDIKRSGAKDYLPPNRFAISPLRQKTIWFVIGFVGLIIYVAFRISSFYYNKPHFSLNIQDNTITENPQFIISGKTDNTSQIILNGEPLSIDDGGAFQKKVELRPGFNTFEFKIKRLLGKEYTIVRQIFYKTTGGNAASLTFPKQSE